MGRKKKSVASGGKSPPKPRKVGSAHKGEHINLWEESAMEDALKYWAEHRYDRDKSINLVSYFIKPNNVD